MLDYDRLEGLEAYALADGPHARSKLFSAGSYAAPAVTKGQAFMAGLHALELGDLDAAAAQVQRLKHLSPHSEHCRRLEALVALRRWPTAPSATCAYLEAALGLSFSDQGAPQAEGREGAGPHEGAAPPRLASRLDASIYSDHAFLEKAVRTARGPAGRGGACTLAGLLSSAGQVAALASCEELALSLDEQLQLVEAIASGAGSIGVANGAQALAGAAVLEALAEQLVAAQRVSSLEPLLRYLTSEQLEGLAARLPPHITTSPAWLAAVVRKMYGALGAAVNAAPAVDARGAWAATQHRTPCLSRTEADAIRLRALELCATLRAAATHDAAGPAAAWLEARALLPFAGAAVWAAAASAAVSDGEDTSAASGGGRSGGASASAGGWALLDRQVAEAAALLARLLRSLAGGGLPGPAQQGPLAGLLAAAPPPAGGMLGHPGLRPPPAPHPSPSLDLGPALPPLPHDVAAIVRQLLSTLLHVAPDPPALLGTGGPLAGCLDPRAQAQLLAAAMLTHGPQRELPAQPSSHDTWAAAYRDAGGDLSWLSSSVELELGLGHEHWADLGVEAPDLRVVVTHKAVTHLSVHVYEMSLENYYRERLEEVGMGVDLEGLGATFRLELPLDPSLPPLRRCRRVVELPQLKNRRGMWIVEVHGGGRSCRLLLRWGQLTAVARSSPAGLALTLWHEDGSPVGNPRVWVDGQMYGAPGLDDAAGAGASASGGGDAAMTARAVLVPYRADHTAVVPAVLVDGSSGFASLASVQHCIEEYELHCAMHLEPESAAGGRAVVAPLLLQPALTIGGWSAPLALLQDVTLTVEVDDLEGAHGLGGGAGARRQVFHDWSPGDGSRAAVVDVRLPDRAGCVSAVLSARLRRVAPGPDGLPDFQVFRIERRWLLNSTDAESDSLRDLHLTRGPGGRYSLRLLGRAGEPHPGVEVVVALTHQFSAALEPPPSTTSSAPPALPSADRGTNGDATAPGAEAAVPQEVAEAEDSGGSASDSGAALLMHRTLVTDAGGAIDLGPLDSVTAIAAGLPPSCDTTSRAAGPPALRRRYCWRLPSPQDGSVDRPADGGGSTLVLRVLAGEGVQACIPSSGLSSAWGASIGAEDAAQAAVKLRHWLGLKLVAVAAVGDSSVASSGGARLGGGCEVSALLDERHVLLKRSCLEVCGLQAGVYMLFAPRFGLRATILVYQGASIGPALPRPAPQPVVTEAASPTPAAPAAAAPLIRPSGFVLCSGLVAPLSEPRPLQIESLAASVEGGIVARLGGSAAQMAAAVVHVVLCGFEPHTGTGAPEEPSGGGRMGRCVLSAGQGVSFGVPALSSSQSGRRQGDEVRYVLERRRLVAEGRIQPMPALVDRPSLLVQPWKVRETATRVQPQAQRGEAFANESLATFGACARQSAMGAADYMSAEASRGRRAYKCSDAFGGGGHWQPPTAKDVAALGLAFRHPAVILANVPVDSGGSVRLSPHQLSAAVAATTGLASSASASWVAAGHRLVRVVAYTPPAAIAANLFGGLAYCEASTVVAGPQAEQDVCVDAALQRPFPAGSACVERRSSHALPPGRDLVLADAATARFQLYGTVSKVWALYGTLLSLAPHSPTMPYTGDEGAKLWDEFSCVSTWMQMSIGTKVQRYSQLACRELAFFCYCHDPEFFRAAVLPSLQLRLPSYQCCLDAWMAGSRGRKLVDVWGAPHRYLTLTPLERILLAWEEDALEAQSRDADHRNSSGSSTVSPPATLSRLASLAADMRSRLQRSRTGPGAAAAAEVSRRRFELALNGPGEGERDGGAGADGAQAEMLAFEDVQAMPYAAAAPPPPAPQPVMAMAMAMAAPPGGMGFAAAAAPAAPPAFAAADMAARNAQAAAPVYRAPPATQEWAEAGWFRRPPSAEPQDPDMLSPESEFWAALAEHLSRGGDLAPKHTQSSSGSTAADTASAFLPRRLDSAGWSFTDALLATAVVGVPWDEVPPLAVRRGPQLALTAAAPTVAYVRQTTMVGGLSVAPALPTAGAAGAGERVVLLQRLLDPHMDPSELPRRPAARRSADGDGDDDEGDGYEGAEPSPDGDGVEVPASSPLVAGRVYCFSVTATNSSPSLIRIDVAVQAPQGAVALGGRPALWVVPVELHPYGTQQLPLYHFYFPAAASDGGAAEYAAFPAAASSRGRLLTVALGQWTSLQVRNSLPSLDDPSAAGGGANLLELGWARVAALPPSPGADAARLRFLAEGDLADQDVGRVAWRCGDAAFWRAALAALKRRRVWNEQIWSYAVLHRSPEELRELLAASAQLRAVLGPEAPAAGALLTPSAGGVTLGTSSSDNEALGYLMERAPHLEYWPLINARAHALGGQRPQLNAAAEDAWKTLLRRLAAVAAAGLQPSTEDLLAAAYHLVLQDRPSEAQSLVDRIRSQAQQPAGSGGHDPRPAPEVWGMQLCYLRAWLALADPATTAPQLRAAAAAVRVWCGAPVRPEPAAGPATAGAPPEGEAAVGGGDGGGRPVPILEPKWVSRLTELGAALEEAASIAAGDGGGSSGASQAAGQSAELGGTPLAAARPGAAEEPRLLLQKSLDERGVVILEAAGLDTVVLNAYDQDLELLFSIRPFDSTLGPNGPDGPSSGSGSIGNFALVRAPASITLDLPGAAARGRADSPAITLLPPEVSSSDGRTGPARFAIRPHQLLQPEGAPGADSSAGAAAAADQLGGSGIGGGGGAVLLEAYSTAGGGGFVRSLLTVYRCDMRALALEAQGVVKVAMLDGPQPVAGAYVKAYLKTSNHDAAEFHKDGYTDRRGLFDYWTLSRKPSAKVQTISLLVSHPQLGSTVLRVQPPAH